MSAAPSIAPGPVLRVQQGTPVFAWSPAEDAIIRLLYKRRDGVARIHRHLPHRSRGSISGRAERLGLRSPRAHWTRRENAILVREWHDVQPRTLRRKLPGRTWCAIAEHAKLLGLPLGIPQGHVSIKEAARRAGYAMPTLRALLVRQGVPMHARCESSARRSQVRRYVEWEACMRAIQADLRMETLTQAAERTQFSAQWLREILRAAGIYRAERGERPRLDPATVDAALAARRARRPGLVRAVARDERLREAL